MKTLNCPCGGASFATCCEPFVSNQQVPEHAVELMRSRYTAYVLELRSYLLNTWHESTRPSDAMSLHLEDKTRWLGLEVRNSHEEGDSAQVEFVARYKHGGGPAHRMHEVSQFVRENGRWFYVDGEFKANT